MTTASLIKNLNELDPEQRSFAMAISIIQDRIRRLPKKDADDLFELLQHYRDATTEEEVIAVYEASLEIVAQEPVTVHNIDIETEGQCDELDKWREFISKQIRDHRKKAEFTQEELAARAGLPQSHVSRIETGKHSPSHVTLEKIAKALDIPISKLDPNA